jgi:hypothetical protein
MTRKLGTICWEVLIGRMAKLERKVLMGKGLRGNEADPRKWSWLEAGITIQ